MYSQAIIERTLDGFAATEGWRPFPHSIPEVEEFTEYIDSIIDMDANSVNRYYDIKPGIRLTQERRNYIRRFILNEQFMCFADAMYFATRYAFIVGVGEEIFRYVPRDSQKIFHSILAEFDDLQVAMELFILKARQLGFTSATAVYFMHRILFRTHTRAVMASVKQTQSDLIGRIQETLWDKLPFWLPPPKTGLKTSQPTWANKSILSIQSGSQAFGIAQGWTPSCVHISEVGDIPNPRKVLEEGLFRAAHSTRNLFFVIEGTGNGDTTWQAQKWHYYKENWGKGGRFRPLFVPPACARDIYPHVDWMRSHPIPYDWHPLEETKRMQRKAELYIRSTDYLAKAMGSNWKMDREYLYFWDCNWREAVASHTEKTWLSQMPCTDQEALQGKFDKVMNDEAIEVITKGRQKGYKAYAITGKTILIGTDNKPYEPPQEEIDYEDYRIPIHWEAPDGNVYDWELIPLKPFDESNDENFFNKLLIFQEPRVGEDYAIGADCADGLGMPNEDRFCGSVNRMSTGKGRDEQVAEFTSNNVNSPQAARILACIAALYGGQEMGAYTTKSEMGCKFAIEQVRKPGDECQHQLKLMGFFYHHIMHSYDDKGVIDPNKGSKEGWRTTKWSRPILLNSYMDAINTGYYKPNSPLLIKQLKELIRKEKDGISELTHDAGKHDDNVFAGAMSYRTVHDSENQALRQEQRYRPDESETKEPSMDWCELKVSIDDPEAQELSYIGLSDARRYALR